MQKFKLNNDQLSKLKEVAMSPTGSLEELPGFSNMDIDGRVEVLRLALDMIRRERVITTIEAAFIKALNDL